MIAFGKILIVKALIKEHGFTIRGLAGLSGVSKTVIGDINTGVIIKINKVQEEGFCRAFKCDVCDLYKYEK